MSQSLKEWLAAQREQLSQDRTEVIPIPGYEQRLAGRYRLLPVTKAQEIGERSADDLDKYADTLINSCVELLEITGPKQYEVTGHRWNAAGVRELFGIELPDGTTSREAVRAVFPPPLGEYRLAQHFVAIDQALTGQQPEIDDELRGNSQAGSAVEEPSISQ